MESHGQGRGFLCRRIKGKREGSRIERAIRGVTLLRRKPRLRAVTPICRQAGTVSQTVDAVSHSLWRRTMNAERVPFGALKERSRVYFGGFRPMKHVEWPQVLERGAPLFVVQAFQDSSEVTQATAGDRLGIRLELGDLD